MSKLREKSKFNLDAAEVLITKNLYAPSVHCSYYSCFQRIKSIFPEYFGLTYNQIDINVRIGKANEHAYLIRYISEQIHENIGLKEYAEFKRKIGDLKEFRVSSDYKEIEITPDHSSKALNIAKEINGFLAEVF